MAEEPPQQKPQAYNPYGSFPAYERTKQEILDAYRDMLSTWSIAARGQMDENKLRDAILSLMKWYVWVHGYTKSNVRPKAELTTLKELIVNPRGLSAQGSGEMWSKIINFKSLTEYVLAAGEYMYELKITDILVQHRPDKYYLVQGMAER